MRPRPRGQLDREVDDGAVGERHVAEVEQDDPAGGERGAGGGVAQHGEGGEVELAAGRELDAGPDLGERAAPDRRPARAVRARRIGARDPSTRAAPPRTAATVRNEPRGQVLTTPAGARSRMKRRTSVVASKCDGLLLGSRPVSLVRGQPWSVPVSADALDARPAVAPGVGEPRDERAAACSTSGSRSSRRAAPTSPCSGRRCPCGRASCR